MRWLLLAAVAPFVAATLAGLGLLWPRGERPPTPPGVDFPTELVDATVLAIAPTPCPGAEEAPATAGAQTCRSVVVRISDGPNEGREVTIDPGGLDPNRAVNGGDKVVLSYAPEAPPEHQYQLADYQRKLPLTVLGVLFAVVVVALGRWRGVAALGGFVIALGILTSFVLPAILEGANPLAVSIVGSSTVMLTALYLSHGVNVRTTSAVLGTLVSLAVTALLALLFVETARLTGFASEEAVFVNVSAQQVNLQGLLLGGIIIGSLGVLDDVTVTQASAVWELHVANPAYSLGELYRSALRIGRDHIASTVNTLVLAYAGASLPLLILFTLADARLPDVLNGEIVAQEVVRTLVGSIGLVASVPITTGLAALVATRSRPRLAQWPPPNRSAPGRRPRSGGVSLEKISAPGEAPRSSQEAEFWGPERKRR
ncbi:MAG: YibE/F family protein [Actinomycetota bacterium]